jgi:hypothetical protein
VVVVRRDADGTGREPHRSCRTILGLEPGEPHRSAGVLTVPRLRPPLQRTGQPVHTRVVGLFAVGRPPWRHIALGVVPRLAQFGQRPSLCRGQLGFAEAVRAFGGPLVQIVLDHVEHVIEHEPARPTMGLQRSHLGRTGIQRDRYAWAVHPSGTSKRAIGHHQSAATGRPGVHSQYAGTGLRQSEPGQAKLDANAALRTPRIRVAEAENR